MPYRVIVGNGSTLGPYFLRRARAKSRLACRGSGVARLRRLAKPRGREAPQPTPRYSRTKASRNYAINWLQVLAITLTP